MRFLWIGLAGGFGSLLRYGVGLALYDSRFPWATLGVNIVGSFALGFVFTFAVGRWPEALTVPVTVGLVGGFTTFSTFSWETVSMAQEGRIGTAAVYVSVSLIGGLVAALLGYAAGTSLD